VSATGGCGTIRARVGLIALAQREGKSRYMKSVFDPSFRYTPSFGTNLKATFARVRREQRQARAQAEEAAAEVTEKVRPIKQNIRRGL
jgi:flagellar hook-basal body complex protein FliE